jgi:dTDP-6-deoxy-L-talose 4-dehydrogenase (NAD+)
MTRRVLLTGATGFVGRQILRSLQECQHAVRAVVRKGSYDRLLNPANLEVIETADLFAEDIVWWAKVCEGIDTVIHSAWYAKPGHYLQASENLACLEGTLTLARGCAQSNVRRFVGIGTCFEYDLNVGVLSVDTPLRPTTVYAGAKVAAFHALSNWLPAQDVQFAWCRLFYLYGEGEPAKRLVPYLRERLTKGEAVKLTSGRQIRDYLDVRVAGRLVAEASFSDRQGAINICSGVSKTVRQMAEEVADEYGRRDLLRFGARADNLVDPPCVVGVR